VKKIKEIKEDEETSLFEEIKFKSQAAMEYLMTYGWAILIIALALGVLYSLGIMNPKNFIPRSPPGSCFVFRPNGPGTTDFISLQGTCGYLPMYVASFNGVNGYIDCGTGSTLPLGNSPRTLCGWARLNAVPTCWQWIVSYGTPSTYNASFIGFGTSFINFGGYINDLMWFVNLQNYVNKWVFICGTYNGSVAKLYVNSDLKKQGSFSWNTIQYRCRIGRQVNDLAEFLNGSIANVQIYNTALTPQEIQYLYQQGLGGAPIRLGSLVGWWPLNGDAKDYSGNNLHGTIYGGVTFVQNYNPP